MKTHERCWHRWRDRRTILASSWGNRMTRIAVIYRFLQMSMRVWQQVF
jgi:hypothetical protein